MTNAINPFAALPTYRSLYDQAHFRAGVPPLRCERGRLLPVQIATPGDVAGVDATFVERHGRFTVALPRANFSRTFVDEGLYYTYEAEPFAAILPECEGFLEIRVGEVTIYSEMLQLLDMGPGRVIEFAPLAYSADDGGSVRIILSKQDALAFAFAADTRFEIRTPGGAWRRMSLGGASLTVRNTDFGAADYPDGTMQVRFTGSLASGRVVQTTYLLTLNPKLSEETRLIPLPVAREMPQGDFYCLEYYNSRDLFGTLYEKGFRQRIYLQGTFDGPAVSEKDEEVERVTGRTDRYASVVKVRPSFVFHGSPDYLVGPLEAAVRHDYIRLIRMADGTAYDLEEATFEHAQGEDPLSIVGTITYTAGLTNRYGAGKPLSATSAPLIAPVKDGGIRVGSTPNRPG